jgi:hypothetical protein
MCKSPTLRIHYGRSQSETMDTLHKRTLRRHQRSAKTLSIVVGAFFVCWLPFFVCHAISTFIICLYYKYIIILSDNAFTYVPDVLMEVFAWLGYMNSTLNPLIYALAIKSFSETFRRSFYNAVQQCNCSNLKQHDSNHMAQHINNTLNDRSRPPLKPTASLQERRKTTSMIDVNKSCTFMNKYLQVEYRHWHAKSLLSTLLDSR